MSVVRYRAPRARIRVEVDPSARDAVPALEALFPDLQVGSEGDGPPREQALRLRCTDEGWELLEEPRTGWRGPAMEDVVGQLELHLARTLLAGHPGLPLHAAGAVLPGRDGALLLAGSTGSGKSTLAALLGRAGARLLGDDLVLLHRGAAGPFRRLLKVEDPARRVFGLPPSPPPLAALWPQHSLLHPEALGTAWAADTPVARVLLPEREPGRADAWVEPLGGGAALPAVVRELLTPTGPDGRSFARLSDALAEASFGRLRYGEADAAVDLLLADG